MANSPTGVSRRRRSATCSTPRGGDVHPLQVVDRDNQRPLRRQHVEQVEHCQADRMRIRDLRTRLHQQQRHLQRPSTWRRERRHRVGQHRGEQLGEPGKRQRRLRFHAPADQDAVETPDGSVDARLPQNRLSDPRLAGQDQHGAGRARPQRGTPRWPPRSSSRPNHIRSIHKRSRFLHQQLNWLGAKSIPAATDPPSIGCSWRPTYPASAFESEVRRQRGRHGCAGRIAGIRGDRARRSRSATALFRQWSGRCLRSPCATRCGRVRCSGRAPLGVALVLGDVDRQRQRRRCERSTRPGVEAPRRR